MTFFPSIADGGHLLHVFNRFNRGIDDLMKFHDQVLRGPSDLTIGERELIAAYVSAQNDCQFCFNSHRVYAASFGIDPSVFDALIEDVETAPIDSKMKPILNYAKKLTKTPSRMVQADVDAVLDAGWSEDALHDAMMCIACFNFMNRIIFGHGLEGHEALYAARMDKVLATPLDERNNANKDQIGSEPYAGFADSVRTGYLPEEL